MNKRQEKKVAVSLVTKIVVSHFGVEMSKLTRAEKRVLRRHTEAVYSAVKLVKEEMQEGCIQ
ncbi:MULTISPECIES: hypothetical protein [unclassified Lysinibacillus]|uniref:hypothetical protein n=1 Tax=unclassified Lysinibacillus TaxID=2636778 RepID=UPI0038110D6F